MSFVRELAHRVAVAVEGPWDRLRRRLRRDPTEITLAIYLAHGSRSVALIRGRALEGPPVGAAAEHEPLGVRLRRMIRRFMTREIPGLPVVVRLGGVEDRVLTDDEGYFTAELEGCSLPPGPNLHDVEVAVTGPLAGLPVHVGTPKILVPSPTTSRLLISDIDDTVLRTGATSTIRMTITTLTGSAWTRSSFAGAAELYRGLVHEPSGVDNPCFYVSSSPWNLYDFLVAFIERSELPTGPLFLRDYGVDEHQFVRGGHGEHKLEAISEILRVHRAPILLAGDTGERDPEIFRSVVDEHGDRVEGILLRHVTDDARRAEVAALYDDVSTPVFVEEDSVALAEAAEAAGLVPAGWTARMRAAAD